MEMTALEKKWADEAAAHVPSLDDAYDKEGSLHVDKIEQKVMDRNQDQTATPALVFQ